VGNFYVNHTVRFDDVAAVAAVLQANRRSAWVAPAVDGQVVVYDEAAESQSEAEFRGVARFLSRELNAACLMVLNHDDSVLIYELYEAGRRTDEYNSNPAFPNARGKPSGRGTRLCSVWGQPAAAFQVAGILSRDFLFAWERHAELAKALALPEHSVATGFGYVEQGEFPNPVIAAGLLRVAP
jgi:hypothetical protein